MRFRRRDKAGLTAAGTSVALSLVAGLGLFALINDTVTSQGNSAESGIYTPPDGQQLAEIALVDASVASCADATYSPDLVGASITSTVDLDDPDWVEFSPINVCVRNVTTNPATIASQYVNVFESEVGACEASEEATEGTGSCADGDVGELAALLYQGALVTEGQCTDNQGTFAAVAGSPQAHGTIPAGGSCRFEIAHALDFPENITEDMRFAAQTDRVDFDLVFLLSDDAAPPPPPSEDLNEPNDDAASATPITTTADGAIDPGTDVDWFAYTHGGGAFSAETTTPDACADNATSDTTLTLYAADGTTQVASNDDGGAGRCSLIQLADLAAGDYFVVVGSFQTDVVPAYTLTIGNDVPPPPAEDLNEPNDDAASATPISTTADGAIDPAGEADWFTYTHAGGTFTAETTVPGGCSNTSSSDTHVAVYASDGTTLVAENEDIDPAANWCSQVSLADLVAGDYYVVVRGFQGGADNVVPAYTLTIST